MYIALSAITQALVGQLTIDDALRETGDNLVDGQAQTVWGLIGLAIVMFAALRWRVRSWVVILFSVGGFWAGWLAWNTFMEPDRPLFPGGMQGGKLWEALTQNPTAAAFAAAVAGTTWPYIKRLKPWKKAVLIASAVFAGSFIYNFTLSFSW